MVSRVIVIVLAFAAAAYRASNGAFVEAIGLAALGGGLLALKFAVKRPGLTTAAYGCFFVTALSIIVVFVRDYL